MSYCALTQAIVDLITPQPETLKPAYSVQELQGSLAQRDLLIAELSQRLHALEDRFPQPVRAAGAAPPDGSAQPMLHQSAHDLPAQSKVFGASQRAVALATRPTSNKALRNTPATPTVEQLAERMDRLERDYAATERNRTEMYSDLAEVKLKSSSTIHPGDIAWTLTSTALVRAPRHSHLLT